MNVDQAPMNPPALMDEKIWDALLQMAQPTTTLAQATTTQAKDMTTQTNQVVVPRAH